MANSPERRAWIMRVLGVELPVADGTGSLSAQRAQEAQAANVRGIAYPKLLLRWRSAQSEAEGALQRIGQAYLALANVKADPRYDQVKVAIAGLPKLVPALGTELADLLDRGISAGSDADIAEDALDIVDQYRDVLAQADGLQAFENFARKYVGELAAVASLDAALGEIAASLEAAL